VCRKQNVVELALQIHRLKFERIEIGDYLSGQRSHFGVGVLRTP
jgi:hypothetical protein